MRAFARVLFIISGDSGDEMRLEIISKHPSRDDRKTPLLFVHGAWHGAWCWDQHFLDYFAEQGFSAHAVSLRGHGASDGRGGLRWTRLAHYVEDVARIAARFSSPPVVIGHSMGGAIAQKYLEKFAAPGCVLLASVPPSGILAATLRIARRQPIEFAKANLTLSLYPIVATPKLAKKAFFSDDHSHDRVTAFAERLQDESYLGFLDMLMLDLPRPHKVNAPVLVLGAADDAIFHPREVEATARAYKTEPFIFPRMAHDMMLEPGWQQVADRILTWLGEQGI